MVSMVSVRMRGRNRVCKYSSREAKRKGFSRRGGNRVYKYSSIEAKRRGISRKHVSKYSSTQTKRNRISRKPPEQEAEEEEEEVWIHGIIRFSIMAYQRSSEQDICYICGDDSDKLEHFCPFNYIFGRFDDDTCTGECPVGEHSLTSRDHRKFLRRFIRVSNLPPGFRVWELENLFSPFGPLLMWDVPMFRNEICGCKTEVCMSFGVVVFKRREDGERAIHELNGYETGGRKLQVDWVYPSCV